MILSKLALSTLTVSLLAIILSGCGSEGDNIGKQMVKVADLES